MTGPAARFTGFTPEAIQFLADLAQNNDRAWFQPRRADYERLLRDPMAALIEALAQRLPDRGRRGVGIGRQERHDVTGAGSDVAGVDPAVGTNETVRRLRDEDAMLHAHDAACLTQDHLELTGVAIPAAGELDRLHAGLDGREIHDRVLGLGDDLLRHHEHVVRTQRGELGPALEGRSEQRAEVVPRPDLGDALEGDDEQRLGPRHHRGVPPGPWATRRSSGVSRSRVSGPPIST